MLFIISQTDNPNLLGAVVKFVRVFSPGVLAVERLSGGGHINVGCHKLTPYDGTYAEGDTLVLNPDKAGEFTRGYTALFDKKPHFICTDYDENLFRGAEDGEKYNLVSAVAKNWLMPVKLCKESIEAQVARYNAQPIELGDHVLVHDESNGWGPVKAGSVGVVVRKPERYGRISCVKLNFPNYNAWIVRDSSDYIFRLYNYVAPEKQKVRGLHPDFVMWDDANLKGVFVRAGGKIKVAVPPPPAPPKPTKKDPTASCPLQKGDSVKIKVGSEVYRENDFLNPIGAVGKVVGVKVTGLWPIKVSWGEVENTYKVEHLEKA